MDVDITAPNGLINKGFSSNFSLISLVELIELDNKLEFEDFEILKVEYAPLIDAQYNFEELNKK